MPSQDPIPGLDHNQYPRALMIYLELTRYPILASRIRERMRRELFARHVVTPDAFEAEVHEKAVESQKREGLVDPLVEEPSHVWATRMAITRDHLTDFYFAYNLPHELFEDLVRQTLAARLPEQDVILTFHPELAPWDMLFAQGQAYEELPPAERRRVEHHLQEIKVVLIRAMISDHLRYVGVAREWLDIADLQRIRSRRIGRGKIGGKAAGVMLAECVLRKSLAPEDYQRVRVPRSWFLGADVFRQFTQLNQMVPFSDQKYKGEEEIRADYPRILERALSGMFPADIVEGLRHLIDEAGAAPLIVRSSSLLEDSFGTAFAGKYESLFCPNQGTPEQNLRELLAAISRVYASVYRPEALLYRRLMGLLDYDERMAVLIQEVQGQRLGQAFLPEAAGVAFSRNQFRWSPSIDRRAGFLRLVWGLGTRAVEQYAGDYPRLVALSHPTLQPEASPLHLRHYSQQNVDLIDLQANALCTLPVGQALRPDMPHLRLIAQRFQDGDMADIVSHPLGLDPHDLVLTFDGLLRRTDTPALMRRALQALESAYGTPVDVEFVLSLKDQDAGTTLASLHLLQCRPQSQLEGEATRLPTDVPVERRLFVSRRMVPDGRVRGIRYIVYIPARAYDALGGRTSRQELAGLIGRVNARLAGERFILLGPGRWGSDNPDLGIPVAFGDIYHARALVEVAGGERAPEPSYGTHFFQDLLEANIIPLALSPDDPGAEFAQAYLEESRNMLGALLPEDISWEGTVRVTDVAETAPGTSVEIVMDGEAGAAMAYLVPPE